MDHIKYIAFVLSFVILILEKFTRTNKTEDSPFKSSTKSGRTLIILSIFFFLIGIYQTIMEDISNSKKEAVAEDRRMRDSISLLRRWEFDTTRLKELLDSSEVIISNSMKTIERSNQNLIKSDSLITAAQENLSQTTGGNSFPLLKFKLISPTESIVTVENIGKYPIYDLNFIFRDIDLLNTKDPEILFNFFATEKNISVGNLGPDLEFTHKITIPLKDPERNFQAVFFTRNGSFMQLIKYRKKPDGTYFATKITRLTPKRKVIYERIDSGFLNRNEKLVKWALGDH